MKWFGLLVVLLAIMALQVMFLTEAFAATSPGTLIQLQTSSTEMPIPMGAGPIQYIVGNLVPVY